MSYILLQGRLLRRLLLHALRGTQKVPNQQAGCWSRFRYVGHDDYPPFRTYQGATANYGLKTESRVRKTHDSQRAVGAQAIWGLDERTGASAHKETYGQHVNFYNLLSN